ncbi:MAG: Xaa-Pro peptidase family protein [Candidatus Sumerlaeia bacterium]|nr:Xaa-Pro peptidase family protein [Candidatus Sumerlaeia bacterium]
MYKERLKRAQLCLRRKGINALIVLDRFNTAYISGFRGSFSIIIITSRTAFLITDDRYLQRVTRECGDIYEILRAGRDPWKTAGDKLKQIRVKNIGFEESLPFYAYQRLRAISKTLRCPLINATDIIRRLRMIKEESEIELIRNAARLTDEIFTEIIKFLQVGMTEREICRQIMKLTLDSNAEGVAFAPIVASGPGSAVPHYEPGDRRLAPGDLLIIDLGIKWQGYCADMTRTVVIGAATRKARELYNLVMTAQKLAIKNAQPGVKTNKLDAMVRSFFANKGYREAFLHSLGHNIGLEVHEPPRLNSNTKATLKPGMVFTLEPGLYINGFGGVRIEDTVLMTDKGVEILTRSSKDLLVV